jgi:transposase
MAKNTAHSRKKKSAVSRMRKEPRRNAAGIDLGSNVHYVAVPEDRDTLPVRHFGTLTGDLHALADWLVACGIETVAMEATGVYWVPIFQILEARGLEVCLVNARHVKNVPGRKSDVQDCQWLQYLHSVGLLNASFRPPETVVALRSLIRHRESLVRTGNQHLLRVQKSLDQMNVLVHHAVSDITGATGQAILDAIIAGERDPKVLAALRDKRCKKSAEQIARALEGDWREEHLFTLRQSLHGWRYHQELIKECTAQIDKQMSALQPRTDEEAPPRKKRKCPDEPMRRHLFEKLGVDLTEVEGVNVQTALAFLCEVGPDVSRFPTAEHFASWLTLCPDNRITGGQNHGAQTRKANSRLAHALRMAVQSYHRSDSPIGDWFRRIRAKLGTKAAVTAAAHKLARILYTMVKHRKAFDPSRLGNPELARLRKEASLKKQAEKLGYTLVPAVS